MDNLEKKALEIYADAFEMLLWHPRMIYDKTAVEHRVNDRTQWFIVPIIMSSSRNGMFEERRPVVSALFGEVYKEDDARRIAEVIECAKKGLFPRKNEEEPRIPADADEIRLAFKAWDAVKKKANELKFRSSLEWLGDHYKNCAKEGFKNPEEFNKGWTIWKKIVSYNKERILSGHNYITDPECLIEMLAEEN